MNNYYNQNNKHGDNIMNIGPQPRMLNNDVERQLKSLIPSGSPVNVTAVLGDGEAFSFAGQIKNYLDKEGYKVDGVDQALYSESIKGQSIETPTNNDSRYRIIIGSNV